LRHAGGGAFPGGGTDVMPAVRGTREKMREFCRQLRGGRWRGLTERPVDTVVCLGIGGSSLGPAMACTALEPFADAGLAIHFVSDLDGAALERVLGGCAPERTLFIVSSKSFGTEETLINARSARRWLQGKLGGGEASTSRHFVAVTAKPERAAEFGIDPANVFEIWDWVGGRYSLWSAVGLQLALQIGMEGFEAMLAGAAEMDQHFVSAPLSGNMPVILALLEVWYRDFFDAASRAVLPYDHALRRFPDYLQQLEMESNGKRVSRSGAPLEIASAPVVWGGPGIDGQHAFFQLLHQGETLIPSDFIVPLQSQRPLAGHHEALVSNALAQTRVLMRGRNESEIERALRQEGMKGDAIESQVPHRVLPGNQPSSLLMYERLDPRTLGALAALYEHKVFVESVIWQTNPFDQFGVETGKVLAKRIRPAVAEALKPARDSSDGMSGRIDRVLAACPLTDD
ncbi:MAG TPA: glucose-6-phosphate isomerase, partial [Gammaproteobacteria bacterium]|nr:glucose-6-phosphate isomerase [Gammaproteobacteria bacterium]